MVNMLEKSAKPPFNSESILSVEYKIKMYHKILFILEIFDLDIFNTG